MEVAPFLITEEALFDLIMFMPNSAHVKSAATGKYIFTNKENLHTYGFTKEEQFNGLSLGDLDLFMRSYWGKDFANKLFSTDEQVKLTGHTEILRNNLFEDRHGFIRCQNICKTPFFGKNKKVTFIITITDDYTNKINWIDLYKKYRMLHKQQKDAILYFTRYIKIEDFFYQQLTEKELLCLLYAKYYQTRKNIAENLNVTIKTVETHLANISCKLKTASISDIIMFLRGGI